MTEVAATEDTVQPIKERRSFGLLIVTISYLLAGGAAVGINIALWDLMHPIWLTLIADVIATIVIFIFSVIFNNVSFYDPYWSLQPIAIVVYWVILPNPESLNPIRLGLIITIVSLWGIRLTLNWVRGWKGLKHEDWRYVKYREEQPKLFWFIAFTGLEMMPTLIVFLGCVALYPALVLSNAPINAFDIIGSIIALGAIIIELVADEQMKIFCKQNKDNNKVMSSGLWKYSRHPNYFGEVTFWWGLFFFALAANTTWWWTIAGPIAMVILFIFISIPLLENKQIAKRPEYEQYKKKVSMFIPWFPKK